MRLKVATTALLIFGVILLAAWPWVIGPMPNASEAGRRALQEYAVRFGLYIIVVLLVWSATAVLAIMVARRAREKYREEAMENLQSLLEESLKDHGKPKS